MNKLQYIKLLELRGITDLKGKSLADALRESGGEGTLEEMVKVNEEVFKYYIDLYKKAEEKIKILEEENEEMQEDVNWLRCLESAGVDNWEGYDMAIDIQNEQK